jgi:hypothetical protein
MEVFLKVITRLIMVFIALLSLVSCKDSDNTSTNLPQTNAPQANEPQTNEPQTNGPQANAPQANAPQANAPQANAPQANAPQANAPQANAPQTNAPQTNAPQTNAPQTNAPQTNAPQTNAPQANGPQIEPPVENDTPTDSIQMPINDFLSQETEKYLELAKKKELEKSKDFIKEYIKGSSDFEGFFDLLLKSEKSGIPFLIIARTDLLKEKVARRKAIGNLRYILHYVNFAKIDFIHSNFWDTNENNVAYRDIAKLDLGGIYSLIYKAKELKLRLELIPIEALVSDIEVSFLTKSEKVKEIIKVSNFPICFELNETMNIDLKNLGHYLLGNSDDLVEMARDQKPLAENDFVELKKSLLLNTKDFTNSLGQSYSNKVMLGEILLNILNLNQSDLLSLLSSVNQRNKSYKKRLTDNLLNQIKITGRFSVKVRNAFEGVLPSDRKLNLNDDNNNSVYYNIPGSVIFDVTPSKFDIPSKDYEEYFNSIIKALVI